MARKSTSAFTTLTQSTATVKTIVTNATYPHSLPKLASILSSPETLIKINPLVQGFAKKLTGNPSLETYTITDVTPVLGGIHTKTTYTATFEYCEDRPEPIVRTHAALGIETKSTWRIEQDSKGHCAVMEVFELVKAPWGLSWYITRTARNSHKLLFQTLGQMLEST